MPGKKLVAVRKKLALMENACDIGVLDVTSSEGEKASSKASKKRIVKSVEKSYSLECAINFLKENSFVKFDESLEIAVNLGVDPKRSDQVVKGNLSLPHGTGKSVKILVICRDSFFDEYKNAGANYVGGAELIDSISNDTFPIDNVDVCITSPDMLAQIGRVAKILGKKGIMPNLAAGTITKDIPLAIEKAKFGQVKYRTDKAAVVHAPLGKLSFSADHLLDNVKFFIQSIKNAKPSGVKSNFIKKISLSSTMNVGVLIDLTCI